MKKILFFITWLSSGWAEKQLFLLSTNLPKDKYQVAVMSYIWWKYVEKYEEEGISVTVLWKPSILNFFSILKNIEKILHEYSPDIVYSFLPHSNIIMNILKMLKDKFSINLWGYSVVKNWFKHICWIRNTRLPSKFLQLWEDVFKNSADEVIVNSSVTYDILHEKWYKNLNCINNAIIKQEVQAHKFEKKTVLSVGKFYPQKDYETNLLVAKKVLENRDDVQFVWVWEWPQLWEMKNKVKEEWLEWKVAFYGKRDDVPALMKGADVFFFPTLFEWQANVLIESLLYWLPIVTTDIPENRSVVTEILCWTKDVDAMVIALEKQLEKKILSEDHKNAESIYTINNLVNKHEEVFEKLLNCV